MRTNRPALAPVAKGGTVAASEIPKLFNDLAVALHMTQPQLAQFLSSNYPAMAQLLQQFPQLVPVFKNVTPGLTWFKPLVTTMNDQVNNFAKVDALPNFNLLTWFFAIPGLLLVLTGGFGLIELRRPGARASGPVTRTVTPQREPAAMV